MPIYDFTCDNCGNLCEEQRSIKDINLISGVCPSCGGHTSRVFYAPEIIDNFMPWVKGGPNMSKKKMQTMLKDSTWSKELPTPQFWKDVHNKKIVRKGNIYERVKE